MDLKLLPKRTRFAPTPSGFLHWGNAYSFILTWLLAKQKTAKILLRIDDLDSVRKRPEFVEDIFRCLDWLGLTYDEGPTGPDDFEKNFSQRHRMDQYRGAIELLRQSGSVFGCACSRSTIQQSADGLHPRSCREAAGSLEQSDVAWRIATTAEPIRWDDSDGESQSVDLDTVMRDFVVRRKDTIPSYQLASVIDDTFFGVDMIVRGADLVDSTGAQIWLADKLGMSGFSRSCFLHHEIVTAQDGTKLSKSSGAMSLKAMRSESASPHEIFQRLSPVLGFPESVSTLDEALSVWLEQG